MALLVNITESRHFHFSDIHVSFNLGKDGWISCKCFHPSSYLQLFDCTLCVLYLWPASHLRQCSLLSDKTAEVIVLVAINRERYSSNTHNGPALATQRQNLKSVVTRRFGSQFALLRLWFPSSLFWLLLVHLHQWVAWKESRVATHFSVCFKHLSATLSSCRLAVYVSVIIVNYFSQFCGVHFYLARIILLWSIEFSSLQPVLF